MFEEDEFNILKNQAEGLEVPVRDKVWQNIRTRLRKPYDLNIRLRKLSAVLFLCLLFGISISYMLESSKQGNDKPSPISQSATDLIPKHYDQTNDHSPAGKHGAHIPENHIENKHQIAEFLVVDGNAAKRNETKTKVKTDVVIPASDQLHLKEIPSQDPKHLELAPSYGNSCLLRKLKMTQHTPNKPQNRITLSSLDFGLGSSLNYSKKQAEASTLTEQSYVQYIHKTTNKMIPVSASILVNMQWAGGLSVGTGLQFLHFSERVSYRMETDSFIVLVDDGRGGMDTNTVYYEKAVPGLGNTIESRTSQLQVPVLVNLHWRLHKKIDARMNAGFNVGLYSAHRSKSEHDHSPGITSFMAKQNHSSFVYSIGAQVSAGFEYHISEHSGIGLKFNYYGTLWNKSASFNVVQQSFGPELSYRLNIR